MNNQVKNSAKNLVLLLVMVLVGVFLTKPAFDSFMHRQEVLNDMKSLNSAVSDKLAEAQAASKANLADTEVEKMTLNRKIPTGLGQENVILQLKDYSEQSDVVLNSVSFSNGVLADTGDYYRAGVNANFTGGYEELLKFLKMLEDSERKFNVRSITVQKGQTEGFLRVNFSLVIEVYYI